MNDHGELRPLPGDQAGAQVQELLDLADGDWYLAADGEYETAAAEAWRNDGQNFQQVVLITFPARRNHHAEPSAVRLMLSPEDAVGLALNLVHTATWMQEHAG